jgi:hypothetical protein
MVATASRILSDQELAISATGPAWRRLAPRCRWAPQTTSTTPGVNRSLGGSGSRGCRRHGTRPTFSTFHYATADHSFAGTPSLPDQYFPDLATSISAVDLLGTARGRASSVCSARSTPGGTLSNLLGSREAVILLTSTQNNLGLSVKYLRTRRRRSSIPSRCGGR